MFRNIVTNYTTTGESRIEIPVGISYADDVMQAADVIKSALSEQKFVTKKDDLEVFAEGLGAKGGEKLNTMLSQKESSSKDSTQEVKDK